MNIKPITGALGALDETRDEERRKKKQEERQKADKPSPMPNAEGPAVAAVAPETLSQISDSESLVKLLEKTQNHDRQPHAPSPMERKAIESVKKKFIKPL